MEKERFQKIRAFLPRLILILCVIQPLLDIAGYWQTTLGIGNSVTMALRMALLGGSVLLGFLLSDRKRYYIILAGVLAVLTALHALACMQAEGGYAEPVTDIVNLVRIYFLPMMTLCFITFLKQNDRVFPAVCKGMVINVVVIALVQLLSTVTGTDPHTYSVDSTGILGWFLWTNSQSAILAMLTPITICWALRRWEDKLLPVALLTAISEATLFVLAPRLAYGSLVAAGIGSAVCLILADRKRWKQALAITLVTLAFLAAYPFSATHNRLDNNDSRAQQTIQQLQELNIQLPSETELPTDEMGQVIADAAPGIVLDEVTAEKLETFYRSQDIIWNMVQRFGRDKVFKAYNYTLDPSILSNTRTMKIKFCELLMQESGTLSHLFGLNLEQMRVQRLDFEGKPVEDNYDVENDFHGVYFLTGIVGLILMIAFLLYFGVRALWRVVRRPKVYFTLAMASIAMAYGLGVLHAYFTASVLRRNNASVYLAMVLAGLWYLSRRELADKPAQPEQE